MSDGSGSETDRSLRYKARLEYQKIHTVGVQKEESLDSASSLSSDVIMNESETTKGGRKKS